MTRDDSDIRPHPGVRPWGLEGSVWVSSSGTLTQTQGLVGRISWVSHKSTGQEVLLPRFGVSELFGVAGSE